MTIPLTRVRAVRGHEPALDGMTLRRRKTGGQLLASAPRAVRSSRVGEQFAALLEHLDGHEKECRATVESWMLNGLPVPAGLLAGVWPDPWWRACLRHLVVRVEGRAELLEEVSEDGRVSVRTADGVPYESPPGAPVTPAHPLLLDDPGPWRRLLAEHDAVQGIEQVSRRSVAGGRAMTPTPQDPEVSLEY